MNGATDSNTCVAMGIFNGVHLGHRKVISAAVNAARESGLRSCVFTFRTDTVTTKGGLPLLTEDEKSDRIKQLGANSIYSPDFSALKELSPEEFVKEILINTLNCRIAVCGEDFRFGKDAQGDREVLKEICRKYGIEVITVPILKRDGEAVSTTRIKGLLTEGDIETSNTLLGEPLCYTLPVSHGNALGRSFGFRTINQQLPQELFLPRFGVYCSHINIDGKRYCGITNIGVKPTIEGMSAPCAETNIFDFDGDLYGETVTVTLLKFVRPEKSFESIEALKAEVTANIEYAKEYFASLPDEYMYEKLAAYRVLITEDMGFDDEYATYLDSEFLKTPDNSFLLELELSSGDWRKTCALIRDHILDKPLDTEAFVKFLMKQMEEFYNRNYDDIHLCAKRFYNIWKIMEDAIANEEPFHTFSYADDCLSWGDEAQTRQLYEKAFDYYK